MTTLAELITPLTSAQIQEAIYAALVARGVTTTTWKPGAVVRTIIAAVAIVLAGFSQLQATIARSGFLDLAEGPWLTVLARYVYNVPRDLGSFATGTIVANNAGGGLYSGDTGDLIVYNSTTGKSYRNTSAFTINPLATGVVIEVQAVELGSGSASGAGGIDSLETVLNGVTITNPVAIVGSDAELDSELRTRCRESLGALSPNGPRDAYLYFAKSARRPNGTSIGITRVRTIADGYGGIDLYAATATGDVTGTVGDLETDLGIVDDILQRKVVPEAVTLRTHSATPVAIPVTYEAWVPASLGKTVDQHSEAAAAAIRAHFATMAIGGERRSYGGAGKVYVQSVRVEVGKGLVRVIDLVVPLPASDITLAANEAPVAGVVDPTIHIVAEDTN